MRTLVQKYQMGMITEDHLVLESLHMLDPEHPELVLSELPDSILERMYRFANQYVHGTLLTNYGLLPAQDQVFAARRWIEKARQTSVKKTA